MTSKALIFRAIFTSSPSELRYTQSPVLLARVEHVLQAVVRVDMMCEDGYAVASFPAHSVKHAAGSGQTLIVYTSIW